MTTPFTPMQERVRETTQESVGTRQSNEIKSFSLCTSILQNKKPRSKCRNKSMPTLSELMPEKRVPHSDSRCKKA